jgi:hypothetical protein
MDPAALCLAKLANLDADITRKPFLRAINQRRRTFSPHSL